MSGTQIPLMVQPFSPFTGQKAETGIEATQAGIGQTQAQTGLIGEQARTAQIGNQIASARLPFLMNAYGQGGGGGQTSNGPPGAIGASGGQDWTGPGGQIMDQNGPFSQLGAVPHGVATDLMLAPPEKWAELVPQVRAQKNAYVNQAIAETLDQSGQADPTKWNQMVANEVQSGWMTASQARNLYGHPELAQTILQSTLPVGELPGTKEAQAAGSAAGAARFELVETTVQNPDGTYQKVLVPKTNLIGSGGAGGPAGQGGGALPADLTGNIQRAAQVYNVPANDLIATARVESGGQSGATSKTGAAGSFQFTGGTASDMGVTNPRDNRQASLGAARLYVENRAALTDSLGRPPASSEIYLAHQQGADGAAALIQAPPTMLAVDALKQAGIPPRNVLVNGGTSTMTAGDFVKKWQTAFNQAAGRPADPSAATATAAPAASGANATVQIPPTGQAPPMGGGAVAAVGAPTFSPGVEASRTIDTEHIKADDTLNQSNLDAAQKALSAGIGIREARDLIANVPTGAFIDQRLALQSAAQQTGSPLLSRISTALTGLTPQQLNDAEFARKLYQNNVVAQEQAVGGVRIGAMFTNFFAKASPNLSLQNGALNEMSNAALVGQQMIRDFANGSDAYTKTQQGTYQQNIAAGKYQPYAPLRNYEATWTADGSPHAADTYAAAVHILNGAPITQAVKGLNPAQLGEAIDVIHRADPAAMDKILARPDVVAWRKSLAAQ